MTRLPEAALHRIWERNDLLSPHLRTTDGRRVVIINAGSPNPDSGPDFLNAVVRIGATTFRGDVEIHTSPSQWHLHGHDRDPRYNRVVLHVTGCSGGSAVRPARTCSGRLLPQLVLPPPLDVPAASSTSRERTIDACAARIRQSRDPHRMLVRLGWARVRRRAGQFGQRLDQLTGEEHGILAEPEVRYALPRRKRRTPTPLQRSLPSPSHWDQLVYEAVMESMGYARNSAAFLLLARTVPLSDLRRCNLRDTERSMGILFGAAGLLPDPATLADDEASAFARLLHAHWRTWRAARDRRPGPEMTWVFFRLRPANFPTARIAATAHLLPVLFSRYRLTALLRMAADRKRSARHGIRLVQHAMTFTPRGFWSCHLHFHDRKKPRGVGLGRDRMAVIILNALLPAALLYARTTGNRALARQLRRSAQHVTAPHEPRIVRDIRERTPNLAGRMGGVEQMGMLELVRRAPRGNGKKERGQQV
jgi:hypothetical protein